METIIALAFGIVALILFATVKFFRVLFTVVGVIALVAFGVWRVVSANMSNEDSSASISHHASYSGAANSGSPRTSTSTCPATSSSRSAPAPSISPRSPVSRDPASDAIDQSRRMLSQVGDAYLGKGRTERITSIVTDESKTPVQAAKEVVREVPTGLPKPVDNFVKSAAIGIFERTSKSSGR
jgi:hypothetical protein